MAAQRLFGTLACLLLLVVIGLGNAAHGAAAGPEPFYGRYKGSGFTQNPSLAYLDFDQRDLDVQIGPVQGGFFVEWTTVVRALDNTVSKRSAARIIFEPAGRPGLYVERGVATHLADGMSWASIAGTTLTVRRLTIQADGSYELQTYDRTLTKTGLSLFFKSDRDGLVTRVVTATLEKQPD